ncbi:MAG: hypothetical protein AAB302_01720 [Deltaproteobacteria bacterium]
MIRALNIISTLFVLLGTYLLSKQLFANTISNTFIKSQLSYKKYDDIPLYLRIIGYLYGVGASNWINIGIYGQDNQIERKLKDVRDLYPINCATCN